MDGGGSKHGAHCDRVDHKQRLGGIELMNKESMRSPLGLALGLGSARDGVEHWRLQRVTAIALVPLTVWFAASLMARAGNDYAAFIAWLRMPFATILVVLLLTTLFYHTALGLQVVIEDYVHSGMKIPVLLSVRFGCFALAVAGIFATLRVAFGV